MNRQEYYPIQNNDQISWLGNFRGKLPGHCDRLGIAAGDYTPILKDAAYLAYLLGTWIGALRTYSKACTVYMELAQMGHGSSERPTFPDPPLPDGVEEVPPGALRRIFAFVQRLKKTPDCDQATQRDLGLLPRPDYAEHRAPGFEPSLLPWQTGQMVKVRFFKYGHEGVLVQSRRGDLDGSWEQVGVTTASPWFDKRPLLVAGQPEVREYRLCFWDKGEGNGDWTAVSRVTVSP